MTTSNILGLLIIIGLCAFLAFQIVGLVKDIRAKRQARKNDEVGDD